MITNLHHISQNVLGEKKKKKTEIRRSDRGMGMENTCAKIQGLSRKNGVDILTIVRKNEEDTSFASNELVLV